MITKVTYQLEQWSQQSALDLVCLQEHTRNSRQHSGSRLKRMRQCREWEQNSKSDRKRRTSPELAGDHWWGRLEEITSQLAIISQYQTSVSTYVMWHLFQKVGRLNSSHANGSYRPVPYVYPTAPAYSEHRLSEGCTASLLETYALHNHRTDVRHRGAFLGWKVNFSGKGGGYQGESWHSKSTRGGQERLLR